MAERKNISRRKFLVRGGLGTLGVLAIGTYVGRNPLRRSLLETMETMVIPYNGTGTEPNLWFELTKENTLIFHSPKVEMGQGIFTGFTQLIADELDLTPDQIQVKGASTETGVVDGMSTGGSLSMASMWQPLREMAAMMREMIKTEAARKMGVDVGALTTKEGVISGNGQTMTYAEASAGVTEWQEPDEVPVPKTTGFKYVGKSLPRVDLKEKVFGVPIYGLDATMPDMLYASITRAGIVGATFKSADTSKAANMPGVVKIVQKEDWVGVVARSYAEALTAKEAIDVTWEVSKKWTEQALRETLQVGKGNRFIAQKEGSALEDSDAGVEVLEFTSPIGAHAQLEPNGAVAHYKDGKVIVILSTQVIGVTQKQLAEALDIDKENIKVIPMHLGGGFGRRLNTDHAIRAVQLSMEVGKPVNYIFTRKEEFQNDQFRPPTHHIMKGKLDEDGYLGALEHHYASGDVAVNSVIFPPVFNTVLGTDVGAARGAAVMYDLIASKRTVQWHTTLPFATSWWRSLGLLANTFAMESFIDEMAIKAGKDPVDFRLKKLSDDPGSRRIRKVLETAVEQSGYQDQVKDGRAMGIAASIDGNSIAAHVAEVSIEEGSIIVHKVTCAFDCGMVVNPDQVKAQCEGAIIMGLSGAMYEKMTLEAGELKPTIYGPYKMVQMRHAPKEIEIHLVQGAPNPLPVGEPPMGPIGAAVGNAVRRLSGIRLTDIPMQEAYQNAMNKSEKTTVSSNA